MPGRTGDVRGIASDGTFARLHEALPSLLSRLRGVKSVTIGVNLNNNLLPVEATLLSVNKDRFHGNAHGVMALLFGAVNPLMVPLFKDLSDALAKPASRSAMR